MPNLGGIFDLRVSDRELRQHHDMQLARLRVPPSGYAVHQLINKDCIVSLLDNGLLGNGPQPVWSSDGKYALIIDGEIFNAKELAIKHELCDAATDESVPSICLLLYQRFGDALYEQLNGLFVLVIYDVERREISIVSDRYGFRPLFYTIRGHRLVFSTELKGVSVLDRTVDYDFVGLVELFTYGQHVMDRTWLAGCRKLMPGELLRFDGDSPTSLVYWSYAYDEGVAKLDQCSYVCEYRALIDRAVDRCMLGPRRIGLFLSGGYDSRVVAASLRESHRHVPTFTFGHPDSRDIAYGKQLADRLGLKHTTLTDDGPYLRQVCDAVVWRTEGMLPFFETTSIRFHRELREAMDIILVGLLGEFGGSHTWPAILIARSRSQAMDAIFRRFVGPRKVTVQRIFNNTMFGDVFAELYARFVASFEAIDNDLPMNIADCWNFTNFQPRGSFHSPAADRHLFEIRAPHMDAELVRFLLTIPPLSRVEQRVYKKLIAYGYPAIRSVPCTNSGKPVNPNFVAEYPLMGLRWVGRRFADAIGIHAGRRRPLGRETSDMASQLRSERAVVDDLLLPLLYDGIFPPDVFDHGGILRIVKEHYDRKSDHTWLIGLLVSWGQAARLIGPEGPVEAPQSVLDKLAVH